MGLREQACRFKQNGHATAIVIRTWRTDHRIKVCADNKVPIAFRGREAGNNIMKVLSSPGKVVAVDFDAIAFKFRFDIVFPPSLGASDLRGGFSRRQ